MKNIGGEILRLITIPNAARDECIHAFEIVLVKLGEAAWIVSRGLDQAAFRGVFGSTLQCRFSSHLRL